MRAVILFMFIASLVYAKCEHLEQAADMLDTKKMLKAYKASKLEPTVKLSDVNQARTYVYRHPTLKELGFGTPDKSAWKPYHSRLEKSSFHSKRIGWEKKLNSGASARVRIDWDPTSGAHYNIEVFKAKIDGKSENIKLKVEFDCAGKKCTEKEVLAMVNSFQ
jgi:hypothetical protein